MMSSPPTELVGAPTPLHRLNRLEYNNTLRDLLGVDERPADAFPPDAAVAGFDNIASGLGMSPALFDLYFDAARRAVDAALDEPPLFQTQFEVLGATPQGNQVSASAWALFGGQWVVRFSLPETARYRISLALSGIATTGTPAPTFVLAVDGQQLAARGTTGTPDVPEILIDEREWPAGEHELTLRPDNFVNDPLASLSNEIIIHGLSVRSVATRAPLGAELVLVCPPHDAGCPEKIIENFARRAYRRPVTSSDRKALLELYGGLLGDEGADDALKLTLRAILMSPKFLYRHHPISDESASQLDDFVLASRLSYFLWSSMPDEPLFEAAARGELNTEAELRRQVRRMLREEKASALIHGFAEQWLGTRLLAVSEPSATLYPNYDDALRDAMIGESKSLFADFLTRDLPVASLVNPDFGYLNDRLADHYGLPRPGSQSLVRVPLEGDQRRGLLELGAWLTAESDSERTSPIRRGRWFLDQFYCSPVPPPPPGVVTELPGGADLPIRERLELHRTDPSCAGCHRMLDPAGLGFERYDAVAAFRETQNGVPLDTTGELPGGLAFDGPRDLATKLATDGKVSACLAEKLLLYALGRELGGADRDSLSALNTLVAQERVTLAELIEGIVLTAAFRGAPLHPESIPEEP